MPPGKDRVGRRAAAADESMTGRCWPRSFTWRRRVVPGGSCLWSYSESPRATAHGRFSQWSTAGLWLRLHEVLDRLGSDGRIDWPRAVVNSVSVQAERSGLARPKPRRPRQTGQQTARALRPGGATAGRTGDRCERAPQPGPAGDAGLRARHADTRGAAGSGPPSCTPTRPTTCASCVDRCAAAGSPYGSPARVSSRHSDSAGTVGSSKRVCPC